MPYESKLQKKLVEPLVISQLQLVRHRLDTEVYVNVSSDTYQLAAPLRGYAAMRSLFDPRGSLFSNFEVQALLRLRLHVHTPERTHLHCSCGSTLGFELPHMLTCSSAMARAVAPSTRTSVSETLRSFAMEVDVAVQSTAPPSIKLQGSPVSASFSVPLPPNFRDTHFAVAIITGCPPLSDSTSCTQLTSPLTTLGQYEKMVAACGITQSVPDFYAIAVSRLGDIGPCTNELLWKLANSGRSAVTTARIADWKTRLNYVLLSTTIADYQEYRRRSRNAGGG